MQFSSPVLLSKKLIASLQELGINTLHPPDRVYYPRNTVFEPPCSLKWARAEHSFELGAFSYAVSGYFFACKIGRYCSFGELVQIGRHSHPLDFISTSPIFYLSSLDVLGVGAHASLSPAPSSPSRPPTFVKKTIIGNDVYIGHDAFVLPGVTVGHGSVIGACSVVTKDVPPYAIVAGSPAKIRRYRFDSETIKNLLESRWWEFAPKDFVDFDPASPYDFIKKANDLHRLKSPKYNPQKVCLDTI